MMFHIHTPISQSLMLALIDVYVILIIILQWHLCLDRVPIHNIFSSKQTKHLQIV